MIDEAQGESLEDTPAPPASTRWAEDPVQDEGGFAPPYVPGRESAAPQASSGEPSSGEPADTEASGAEASGAEPTGPEASGAEATGAMSGATETADAGGSFPFEAESDDDFPFDQFNIEGDAEPAVEERAPADEYEAAGSMGWSPADLEEEEEGSEVEDDAEPPMESIPEAELVPIVDDPFADDAPAEEELVAEPAVSGAADGVDEAAALLDRLARTLREDGEEALRREMDSPDRLTALLSGLVAGYLSGRS